MKIATVAVLLALWSVSANAQSSAEYEEWDRLGCYTNKSFEEWRADRGPVVDVEYHYDPRDDNAGTSQELIEPSRRRVMQSENEPNRVESPRSKSKKPRSKARQIRRLKRLIENYKISRRARHGTSRTP